MSNTVVNKTFPCSAYTEIGAMVYFRRMADKVRLQQAGQLPDAYIQYLGDGHETAFDSRCSRFLGIRYEDFASKVKAGLSDEALFDWAFQSGKSPSPRQVEIWNAFMAKRGWRDESTAGLKAQLQEQGITEPIETHFDFFDLDEGRPLRKSAQTETLANVKLPSRPLILPELRSPFETLGNVVHVPRMLDKIRLHQAGKLPEEWVKAKGVTEYFDGLCCEFLGIPYQDVESRVLQGASDTDILTFVQECGTVRTAEEIKIFNTYLAKRGWRDQFIDRLHFRLGELGLPPGTVLTMFEFIDLDEGRPAQPDKLLVF